MKDDDRLDLHSMNRHDTLAAALAAFIREHEYCGEDTDLEGDRFWLT
jgi:hypothetical protein